MGKELHTPYFLVDEGLGYAVTLDKLSAAGVEVFRTDLQGTITAVTSGSGVTIAAQGKQGT